MSVRTYTIARMTTAISAKITELYGSLGMTPDSGIPVDLNAYPRRLPEPIPGKTNAMGPLTQRLNAELLDSIDGERERLERLARQAREKGLALGSDETVIFAAFVEAYVGRHRANEVNVGRD